MIPKNKTMRTSLLAIGFLLASTSFSKAAPTENELSASTRQEIRQARAATAKYHDVAAAEADGYVNIGLYIPNEGLHYVNFGLIDGTFDNEHPEVLLYAPTGDGELQLVGVEYLVPLTATPPVGFSGALDQWRSDAEGFGLWELTVWLWLSNPEGLFADDNPRVP
jgi:hypothetical protein